VAQEDKDKDGSYVDPVNPESVPATLRDPDDNNPSIKAGSVPPGSIGDTTVRPVTSVSTKSEAVAEINAEFKVVFGEDVPKELAQAYYNQLSALQRGRSTKRTPSGDVDIVIEGVSPQERRDILEKITKAYATAKIELAKTGDPKAVASLQRGSFGVTYTTLKKAYSENGIPFNDAAIGKLAVESSVDSKILNSNINLINLQAKTYFPALADKIDKGYTVKQLLSPYLQTRANILEEDADGIDLKELQSVAKDPKGLMGLYDYEISLRKDPKWRFTKNAQDSLGGLARDLTKMFGLAG
jgi:hypothetical protein